MLIARKLMKAKDLLALLLLPFVAFGCSQPSTSSNSPATVDSSGPKDVSQSAPFKTLVGKWSVITKGGSGTLEFLPDGSLTIKGRSNQAKDEITMQAKWVGMGGTESYPAEVEIEYISGNSIPGGADPKGEKVRMKLHWLNDNEIEMTPTHAIGKDGVVVETENEESQVLKRIHGA